MIVVDARGLRCPLPVLKLRKAAIPGSIIDMIADDPAAGADVPAFAAELGWRIEETGSLQWRLTVPA